MVFGFILKSIKFFFILFFSTQLLYIVLTPSAILFSYIFSLPVEQLDDSLSYVFAVSLFLVWFHVLSILIDSDFRSWGGLNYLFISASLTSFFMFFGSKYPFLFNDSLIYSIGQNIGVATVTHIIPHLVIDWVKEGR